VRDGNDAAEVFGLKGVEGHARADGHRGIGLGAELLGQIGGGDRLAVGEDDGAFDYVAQFAEVAGPE